MIVGIGVDLIEIDRIRKAAGRQSFLVRCFTDTEIKMYSENVRMLSGNFAVKEAVSKAFGTGFRNFEPKDIEVLRNELGKPYVNLYGNAKLMAEELFINDIHVSITNTEKYAQAFVIAERGD